MPSVMTTATIAPRSIRAARRSRGDAGVRERERAMVGRERRTFLVEEVHPASGGVGRPGTT
jgi:hypothetical protein